jgi:ATP-dependent protease ClpP protease subunit
VRLRRVTLDEAVASVASGLPSAGNPQAGLPNVTSMVHQAPDSFREGAA